MQGLAKVLSVFRNSGTQRYRGRLHTIRINMRGPVPRYVPTVVQSIFTIISVKIVKLYYPVARTFILKLSQPTKTDLSASPQ